MKFGLLAWARGGNGHLGSRLKAKAIFSPFDHQTLREKERERERGDECIHMFGFFCMHVNLS